MVAGNVHFVIGPTIKLELKAPGEKGFLKGLRMLTRKEVLVGVPEKTAPRREAGRVSNALLAYVHDNGSPLAHIPPRPFLRTGIMEAREEILRRFRQMGEAAMKGDAGAVDRGMHAVGLTAQKAVRHKITVGPFTPLKASTIRARKRRHPSRKNISVTPLVDTGQLRQSINYVVRDK